MPAREIGVLETRLREIRFIPDTIRLVFSNIENREFNCSLDLPETLRNMDEAIAKHIFLSRYMVAIVKDCVVSPVNQDIILAAYGFLDGYENLDITRRHELYCQKIGINKSGKPVPLCDYWPKHNQYRSMNSKENSALKKLNDNLEAKLVNRGSNLPYTAKAKELCNQPFPTPNYLLGNGYRKCEIDGEVFYVPLSDKELRSLSNNKITYNEAKKPKNDTLGEDLDYHIDGTDDAVIDENINEHDSELLLLYVIKLLLLTLLIRLIKQFKKALTLFIVILIIIEVSLVPRNKNTSSNEGAFQGSVPQSILDGIQDTDIKSGNWEYSYMKDGKTFKTKVSVSHEQVTDEIEPDE